MKNKIVAASGVKAASGRSYAPVTLDMVAAAAGVSPSTVSRILNGTAVVSAVKKKAVDDAIAELGFVPNPMARGLAGGRTLSIGVVTQAIDSPFYGVALSGIEDALALNFDNFTGGLLATQHLITLGHRRIAFITGDPAHPDANDRLRGYRTALEQADIPFEAALVVPGEYHEVSGQQAVDRLLASHQQFTAIFAANDQMAFGAALALHRHSLRVPEDISLVGFDDLPSALYAIPPLSTIHHPAYELGQLAARAMLQLIAGEKPTAEVPAPRLVARQSSRRLGSAAP